MGIGAAAWLSWENADKQIDAVKADSGSCVQTPQETDGPYFVEEMLNRSDLRIDPTDNSVRPGLPLNLTITVHQVSDTGCAPLANAQVDLWHCDAAGTYSDVAAQSTEGKKFLRGYQTTDSNGAVHFTTIYPGWYGGRTVHIHAKIRVFSGSQAVYENVTQLFFDDSITDQVYTTSPYNQRGARDTRNATDSIYSGASTDNSVASNSGAMLMLQLTQTSQGYAAAVDLGVRIDTNKPAIAATNGVVNAAGLQPGVVPGSWIAISGTDLASFAYVLNPQADLVNGALPTTLSGVSVSIDGKPAFPYSVSPTQIIALAPADTATDSVSVTVTNFGGTSDPAMANLESVQPAFFTSQGYVAALDAVPVSISSSTIGGVNPIGDVNPPGGFNPPGDGMPPMGAPPTGGPPAGGTPPTGLGPSGAASTAVATYKPGDVAQLYGTGFGPTTPAVTPGTLAQTSAPVSSPVTVTIGGAAATVSSAVLSSAGLYQISITIPSVANGDQEVIAQVAGVSSPPGVLIKIQ
jgi:protocatechuate 3,4-dioxygenase beta subunit